MAAPLRIRLPFLGDRHYLHGSTLFEALLHHSQGQPPLDFKFKGFITSNMLELRIGKEPGLNALSPAAMLTWGEERDCICALELPAEHPIESIPLSEDELMAAMPFADDRVTYDKPWPMGFADTLFCLLKKLELQYKDNVGGQWLFGGMQLSALPRKDAALCAIKDRLLPQCRLLRMQLTADGEPFGVAYTSWVPNDKMQSGA